ncbi:F-box protein [Quillaja saponaria]|uniref:F-box protein n=1 Tax=Quillaja saponaria TaxID=32244 RepID=A0AAD7PWW7_QUISA|nr:F-box protein [Quillaja saponaria]
MVSFELEKTDPYLATESSISAATVANNEDILIEILLRLPIKSLLKFKSVCKQWLSLISNPNFSNLRNPFHTSASGLFLRRKSFLLSPQFDFVDFNHNPIAAPSYAPFKSLPSPSGIKILQSCNGLLLCSCFQQGNRPKTNYYIYNPTTKQYYVLPPFGSSNGGRRILFGVSLAFDPFKSPHYKVVCLQGLGTPGGGDNFQFEIYSSDTGTWRVSTSSFSASGNIQFYGGVYWNGSVHWVSTLGKSMYFKIDTDQALELPMPPIPNFCHQRKFNYFGESRDHLHLIEIYNLQKLEFNVYEMEWDYSGWFVKYHVDLDHPRLSFELKGYMFSILCVVRGESDEDSYLVIHVPGKVLRFTFQDKTFHNLYDIPTADIDDFDAWCPLRYASTDAYQYIESLACVR